MKKYFRPMYLSLIAFVLCAFFTYQKTIEKYYDNAISAYTQVSTEQKKVESFLTEYFQWLEQGKVDKLNAVLTQNLQFPYQRGDKSYDALLGKIHKAHLERIEDIKVMEENHVTTFFVDVKYEIEMGKDFIAVGELHPGKNKVRRQFTIVRCQAQWKIVNIKPIG